jgi:cystinosin
MNLRHALFCIVICTEICSIIGFNDEKSVIAFEPSTISLVVNENRSVIVRLLIPDIVPPDVSIRFLYDNHSVDARDHIDIIPNITFTKHTGDDLSRVINIHARRQGHLVVTGESSEVNIPSKYDFLLIDIARSQIVSIFIQIVGWIYFFAWSISFYPQIILNFRRRSVLGLNFDFLALNLLGHSCYAIYNISLYTSHDIQQEYFAQHPYGVLPVLLNDVS